MKHDTFWRLGEEEAGGSATAWLRMAGCGPSIPAAGSMTMKITMRL